MGDKGWGALTSVNEGIRKDKPKITLDKYVKYWLAFRKETDESRFNPLHWGGLLFQEWIVDQCLQIDQERLDYNRTHVNKKIASVYDTINEYLRNKSEEMSAELGKKIILPSSYIGSPRYMSEAYDDAMGIVRAFGKPDIFMTMTCNPQ